MEEATTSLTYPLKRYCQEGDDSLLLHLLHEIKCGFFVEVGANHPMDENVTYLLEESGWTGLSIDANATLSDEWELLRPRSTFLVAVVAQEGRRVEFVEYADSTLNSISPLAHVKAQEDHETVTRRTQLDSRPLQTILEEWKVDSIDLLSINARSSDLDVLRSLDFAVLRPRAIRIEMLYFSFHHPCTHEIYDYLSSHGYALVIKTLRNGIWIDPECAAFSWLPSEMLVEDQGSQS